MFKICLFYFGVVVASHRFHLSASVAPKSRPSVLDCREEFYEQDIDHFGNLPTVDNSTTFPQRYFVCNDKHWQAGDPVFFYCGNEANVELYVNNSGLMWESAQDFNAKLVFMEHRYFGKSVPFGKLRTKDARYMNYLTVDQALMDYAKFLFHYKADARESAYIGFGGSYGGMLCTWLRMKYPDAINGCIAGSAPVMNFVGNEPMFDLNAFAHQETLDASASGGASDTCASNIAKGWDVISQFGATPEGRKQLQQSFSICAPLGQDAAETITEFVTNAISFMTMGSYPYPSNYMLNGPPGILPAYPMRVGCGHLNTPLDGAALLDGLGHMAGVFYNNTNDKSCFDMKLNEESQRDGELWGFLVCSCGLMPMSTDGGDRDMFKKKEWNTAAEVQTCKDVQGIRANPRWAVENFGRGPKDFKKTTSNIVWSNGDLDPWKGTGILTNVSDSLFAIVIPEVGHHIDLMFSDDRDTDAVRWARDFEKNQIQRWIQEHASQEIETEVFM